MGHGAVPPLPDCLGRVHPHGPEWPGQARRNTVPPFTVANGSAARPGNPTPHRTAGTPPGVRDLAAGRPRMPPDTRSTNCNIRVTGTTRTRARPRG
nr:hypothetical protein RVX_2414 [Nitratidesulfovibrio sp. HK-II]